MLQGLVEGGGCSGRFIGERPNAPLVLALIPDAEEAQRLSHVAAPLDNAALAKFEPPLAFLYIGLDPSSLATNLTPILDNLACGTAQVSSSERWDNFRQGSRIPLDGGVNLADASAANLSGGFRSFEFAARTNWMENPDVTSDPLNFVDPVLIYQRRVQSNLLAAADVPNSLLDVVTKDRVLFTFRDEWNSPIEEPGQSVLITDGVTQRSIPLGVGLKGSFIAPSGMSSYTVSLAGRKITHVSDPDRGPSTNPLNEQLFSISAPAHYVLGTVRPEDWFHLPEPGFSDPTKDLPLYTEGNTVKPLVDGFGAFSWIVADLKKVNSADHFFLFCNWWAVDNFALVPDDPSSTLQQLMQNIDAAGAPIRALIWHIFVTNSLSILVMNAQVSHFIDSLPHGQAILDSRTHHAFTPPVEIDLALLVGNLVTIPQLALPDIAGIAGLVGDLLNQGYHAGTHHTKS